MLIEAVKHQNNFSFLLEFYTETDGISLSDFLNYR